MLTARPSISVRVTKVLGVTQTLAWASSYYSPAILATPMASDLDIEHLWVFAAFSEARWFESGYLLDLTLLLIMQRFSLCRWHVADRLQ
ncbi:MAG TPA: hypothetical protein VLO12_07425 [Halomonas sp.]|nr:hypothetical protein [Halomonas sp.]